MEKKVQSYELRVAPLGLNFENRGHFLIKANYQDGTSEELDERGLSDSDQRMIQKFVEALDYCSGKVSRLDLLLEDNQK